MSDLKQSVHDQFARVADQYRRSPVHASGPDLEWIRAVVRQSVAPHVLDVGCGAGHVARAVAPLSRAVVALDLTEAMLAQVERQMREHGIGNVVTRRGDAEHLPFEDGSFDVVVSRYSAHHWPDPQRAVRECLRVLRPGGQLLISDIVAPEQPAIDTFVQTIELLRDTSHVRDHRVSEWQALFAQAGAASELLNTWEVPLDFAAWVERIATPPPQVAMLRVLLDAAPREVRQALKIEPDHRFTLQAALFLARRAAAG